MKSRKCINTQQRKRAQQRNKIKTINRRHLQFSLEQFNQ